MAAVEGRLLFDPDALEFVGVAPRGGGYSLRPEAANVGYTFGAYGLHAQKGHTTLDLVVYPEAVGQARGARCHNGCG